MARHTFRTPGLAAAQFIELCRADLFYRVVYGVVKKPKEAEIAHIVEAAVDTFMAKYGPTASGTQR